MKQKLFLALITFGLLFVIFSIKANSASAATLGAEFKNQAGFIGLTVYYRFWNGGAPTTPTYATAYVEAGSVQSRFTTVGVANNPSVEWYTDCADPNTTLTQWANNFWGVSVKVHAENPCGEPVITTISCTGSPSATLTFSWQMTGRAAGLPYNVERYHFFRSQAPDSNPDDNYTNDPLVTSASSGTKSWSGLTPGATYYVRISAAPPPVSVPNDVVGDEGWSDPRQGGYSSTACQSASVPQAPINLSVTDVPDCSNDTYYSGVDLAFKVSGATGAILQLYRNGVFQNQHNWSTLSEGSAYDLSVANIGGFVPNTLYTWRVRAGNGNGWSTWVDGPNWNVSTCPKPPWTPTNLDSTVPSCSNGSFTASFTWQSQNGSPSPTKTEFKIGDGGAAGTPLTLYSHSASGFQPNTSYLWYVRFGNDDGWSGWNSARLDPDLFGVPPCTLPDLTITSLTTDKSDYTPGSTVNVTFQIKNRGGAAVTWNAFYVAYASEPKNLAKLVDCSLDVSQVNRLWAESVPFGAGATKTYTPSFTAPSTPGTYKIRAAVDWACLNAEVDDTILPQTMGANNSQDITFTVASAPTNPANLTVSQTCDETNNPQVTFSWTDSANETGYWLDVNNLAWTGPSTPDPWAVKTVANVTSFVWSIDSQLDSGSVLRPVVNTTYWWRLKAFNGAAQSSHVYPVNTTEPPGISFTTSPCQPDLEITINTFSVPSGTSGQTVIVPLKIKNIGSGYTVPTPTDTDSDGDGFSDQREYVMGTDMYRKCSQTTVANDESVDAWPVDFDDNQIVDLTDALMFKAFLPSSEARYDLNGDGGVDNWDLAILQNYFNQNCKGQFGYAIVMNGSSMDCNSPNDYTALTATLAPGASKTFNVPMNLPSSPGNYTAVSMADSDCRVVEPDEGNNKKTATYTVSGFDLSASFVGGTMKNSQGTVTQSFQAGETVTVDLAIKNTSAANITSPATGVGVWSNQTGESNLPNCSIGTSATPPAGVSFSSGTYSDGRSGNVNSLDPNTSQAPDIRVTFTASNFPGIYRVHAYVIPSCSTTSGSDSFWDNNSTAYSTNTYITYTVKVDGWFETTGGDVGSKGSISVSKTSPAGRFQSGYLLARANFDTSVASKWRIDSYAKPLVAADPYDYMAERFLAEAKTAKAWKTGTIPSGDMSGFNYYDSDAHNVAGGAPNGNPSIIFINGNLNIDYDLILASGNSAVFIVSGNITVKSTVTRVDGIYIAGGTFQDTSNETDITGSQLVINGAVYGSNVSLIRKLGQGATCAHDPNTPATCNNTDDPGEVIFFDPKYLIALNDLLGSPGVSWKEVAP